MKAETSYTLKMLAMLALLVGVISYAAHRVNKEFANDPKVMLDLRYWECTRTYVQPVGMAIRTECSEYRLKGH